MKNKLEELLKMAEEIENIKGKHYLLTVVLGWGRDLERRDREYNLNIKQEVDYMYRRMRTEYRRCLTERAQNKGAHIKYQWEKSKQIRLVIE